MANENILGKKVDEKEQISYLFNNKYDIEKIREIFSIDLAFIPAESGMSEFQLKHFLISEREFPTDLMKFRHAKFEIKHRRNIFIDLYYQYRESEAKIKLAEGEIEDFQSVQDSHNINSGTNQKIKDAKIELQRIEIEKNRYKIHTIEEEAAKILTETKIIYDIYNKFKKFDEMSKEELLELEEDGWKVKSAYYPELQERYWLTPEGFEKLPHENGGLKTLLNFRSNNQK